MTATAWEHSDEGREWYRLYRRRWRAGHSERNRELIKQSNERYAAAHPDKVLDVQARRRARKHTATVEDVDRLVVWETHGGICGICHKPVPRDNFHLDHIIPLAKGGEHSYANTQPAHPPCNLSKGSRG